MARKGKSEIRKRPPGTPIEPKLKEIRIPIKKKTADNILVMNRVVSQKLSELREAQANLQNHVVPLITERGLPDATQVVEVTEEPPYELVVMVPKGK